MEELKLRRTTEEKILRFLGELERDIRKGKYISEENPRCLKNGIWKKCSDKTIDKLRKDDIKSIQILLKKIKNDSQFVII